MIIKFKENRVHRAYYGGKRIDRFAGKAVCEDGRSPEEWLASTVTAFNPDCPKENEGLSVCEDGRFFRDVLTAEPDKLLGAKNVAKHGQTMSLLVKLLDSAERLVIQCHPTVPFAKQYFHSDFGKTECWYILDTDGDAHVYLGFKEGVTREKWVELFENQDTAGMLDCLHRFSVKPGELWFVSGGVPHAIGGGCFMIELQEPSDLMVIPERVSPSGIQMAESKIHGGLGFERMFDCFEYTGASAEETRRKYCRTANAVDNVLAPLVDRSLTDKFSMQVLRVNGEATVNLQGQYAVMVVTDGEGTLTDGDTVTPLKKGDKMFIAASTGDMCFSGSLQTVFCVSE